MELGRDGEKEIDSRQFLKANSIVHSWVWEVMERAMTNIMPRVLICTTGNPGLKCTKISMSEEG